MNRVFHDSVTVSMARGLKSLTTLFDVVRCLNKILYSYFFHCYYIIKYETEIRTHTHTHIHIGTRTRIISLVSFFAHYILPVVRMDDTR